jgi:beta-lactamase regulating signal transducer with metallopeptidase domain
MLAVILDSALRSLGLGVFLIVVMWGLRVRSSSVEIAVWTAFLVGALAMPALVRLSPLSLPLGSIPGLAAGPPTGVEAGPPTPAVSPPARASSAASETTSAAITAPVSIEAGTRRTAARATNDALALATGVYLIVAGGLLARICVGLAVMQTLRSRSRPLRAAWIGEGDVRVSGEIAAPVVFGRTILLPSECESWSDLRRRAVLTHERAHLAGGDFALQLLALLHRALFWASPLSWWLVPRLSLLAETTCDQAAVEALGDRASYASILVEIASRAQPAPIGVAMARRADVGKRLDAILKETKVASAITWKKKAFIALAVSPALALAAIAVAQNTAPAASRDQHELSAADLEKLAPYLGSYRLDPKLEPDMAVRLTREDNRIVAHAIGWNPRDVTLGKDGDLLFDSKPLHVRDIVLADGKVTAAEFYWQDRYIGVQRIDDDEAKSVADLYVQRRDEQAAPHNVVAVDPKLFDNYVGFYRLSKQKVFSVTREGDHLFNQTTGQRKFEIFPESDRKFFYTISAAQVSFEPDADGRIVALVLHQDGRERYAPRISAEDAAKTNEAYARRLADEERPRTLVPVEPKIYDAYVGRYALDPGRIFTATREGVRLFMQLSDQKKFEIFPESEQDFFYTVLAAQISFQTDEQGCVVGLVLHQNGWDMPAERID